jgi:ABC-type multidrug transport system ATPase subunit
MIEINGVSKRYKDKKAVDDLSFEIQPGQVTGFLGPNGSGKSTTMRMIMGLDAPDSGSIRINGRRYRDMPLTRHCRRSRNPALATIRDEGQLASSIRLWPPRA